MTAQIAEQVQRAYTGARQVGRIGLSDFSHGRKWREDLADTAVIEIVDRADTAGWLVSDEGMNSLIERIETLEEELEQARLSSIFAARAGRSDWKEGHSLADAAKKSARKRRAAIEEAAHAG